jgi:cytochrome c peroxidase
MPSLRLSAEKPRWRESFSLHGLEHCALVSDARDRGRHRHAEGGTDESDNGKPVRAGNAKPPAVTSPGRVTRKDEQMRVTLTAALISAIVCAADLGWSLADDDAGNHGAAFLGNGGATGGLLDPLNPPTHSDAPGFHPGSNPQGESSFFNQQFGTNGRTCGTCHDRTTGTMSPQDVEARFAADPNEPLFRALDSDDGLGAAYTRLRTRATIRVRMPLPPNVALLDKPGVREIFVNRGVPTMFNSGMNEFLMLDGRETDLATQARSAVFAHFEPAGEPDAATLDQIAEFERTLLTFSPPAPPSLPDGTTDLEKKGREFFVNTEFDLNNPKRGLCGQCHGGPMLNTVTRSKLVTVFTNGTFVGGPEVPVGERFINVFVSLFNGFSTGSTSKTIFDIKDFILSGGQTELPGTPTVDSLLNPIRIFTVQTPDHLEVVRSPDPGRMLVTGDINQFNAFRIPTLWGIGKTAPYFHDNSASDLEAVLNHYELFFTALTGFNLGVGQSPFTPEDRAALLAYMKLL